MNKNIGDMTDSELKDFIIELQEENSRYERKNQKYKEVIDKAKAYIEELNKMMSRYWFTKLLDILKEVE